MKKVISGRNWPHQHASKRYRPHQHSSKRYRPHQHASKRYWQIMFYKLIGGGGGTNHSSTCCRISKESSIPSAGTSAPLESVSPVVSFKMALSLHSITSTTPLPVPVQKLLHNLLVVAKNIERIGRRNHA